jgi:hypothetical protein
MSNITESRGDATPLVGFRSSHGQGATYFGLRFISLPGQGLSPEQGSTAQ